MTTGPGTDRRLLTAGLVLTISLVGFESLAVATVMPAIEQDLGDIELYGSVFSAFFLGSLVGAALTGTAADRRGPAPVLAIAVALFVAGLVAAGCAPTMTFLVGGRALQGLGGGAIPALAYTAVARGYAPARRARILSLFSAAWMVPGLIGPAVSGLVADHFTWRAVFLGLVPVALAAAALTIPALRRLPHTGTPPRRPAGNALAAVCLAAGAGLLMSADRAPAVAVVPLALAGAAIAVGAFRRLVPPGTLALRRGMPSAVALRGIVMFGFYAADAYVTLTYTEIHSTSTAFAGIALSAATVCWVAGTQLHERLIDRLGPRRLVGLGASLVAGGIVTFSTTTFEGTPVAVGIFAWGAAGLGMGLLYPALTLTVLSEARAGEEGAASGGLQVSETFGIALGTGVAGKLLVPHGDAAASVQDALLGIFVMAAMAAVFAVVASRRLPRSLEHRGEAVGASADAGAQA